MKLTIHEFADKYKISLAKLRKVEGDKWLTFAPSRSPDMDSIRFYLSKGQSLTSGHLRYLLRDPDRIFDLGGYIEPAQRQLAALGDAAGEAWPADKDPANLIDQAARPSPEYLDRLAQWALATIPADGCGYHYLAARLILNVPDGIFDYVYRRLPRAIFNLRHHPALAGMSATENRKTRFFQRDL